MHYDYFVTTSSSLEQNNNPGSIRHGCSLTLRILGQFTLPKTNMAMENPPFEKMYFRFSASHLSFQGCIP